MPVKQMADHISKDMPHSKTEVIYCCIITEIDI